MNRIQRQAELEKALTYDHYRQLDTGRSVFHNGPRLPSACPECQSLFLTLTWGMSAAFHAVDVAALFRKGQTRGVCAPKHEVMG